MNIVRQVVILSAFQKNLDIAKNVAHSTDLRAFLDNYDMTYKHAIGVYKGDSETSFVVIVENEEQINKLRTVAFKQYNQESILLQDSNQLARLEFSDGTTVELGKLVETTSQIAKQKDAYTFVDGKYYITTR